MSPSHMVLPGAEYVVEDTGRSYQFVRSLDDCHLKEYVPAKAVGARVNDPPPVRAVILTGRPATAPVEVAASWKSIGLVTMA